MTGGNEEAVDWLRPSVETFRYMADSHFYLAAALAHLRREDEARAAAKAGLAIQAEFTIARLRAMLMRAHPSRQKEGMLTHRVRGGHY